MTTDQCTFRHPVTGERCMLRPDNHASLVRHKAWGTGWSKEWEDREGLAEVRRARKRATKATRKAESEIGRGRRTTSVKGKRKKYVR